MNGIEKGLSGVIVWLGSTGACGKAWQRTIARAGRGVKDDNSELGVPVAQLALPVPQSGDGGDHKGGAVHAAVVQAAKERDQLDRLPETHLIAHDACMSIFLRLYRTKTKPMQKCTGIHHRMSRSKHHFVASHHHEVVQNGLRKYFHMYAAGFNKARFRIFLLRRNCTSLTGIPQATSIHNRREQYRQCAAYAAPTSTALQPAGM